MNITELLDRHETIETEETLREICRQSDIPRTDVLVRDIRASDFDYNNAEELVLHTLAVMLETSQSQLVIDVINDNHRKKQREDFVEHKAVSWSYPYKGHNKGHGDVAYREYYIKRKAKSFTLDEILWEQLEEPLVINKDYMFVKFSHNFDSDLLESLNSTEPDTRDYSEKLGRFNSKHILSINGQTVRGNTNTGKMYRTQLLADPEFRAIWNKSLEQVARVRRLPLQRDEYGDIVNEYNLLMYDFVLDFDHKANDVKFDVTYYRSHLQDMWNDDLNAYESVLAHEGFVYCNPTAVGLVLYLPTSASDSFYIAGHHEAVQKRNLWEHEVGPGEAVFLSNRVQYELLNFDQEFKIYGFNIVSVCPVIDPEYEQDWHKWDANTNPYAKYLLDIKRQQINTIEKSRRRQ